MEYCSQCGELVEGRFCRMCGAPTAVAAAQTAVRPGMTAAGYGPAQSGAGAPGTAGAEATQYYPAGGLYPAAQEAPTATPSEFDGFFRSADGSPSPHSHTQLLPPVVAQDYRMDPPGGGRIPPAGEEYPDEDYSDEDARHTKILRYGALGAVLFAAAIILGMLYLGGNNGPATTTAGSTTPGAAASPTSSAADGTVVVPTQSAGTIPSNSPAPVTSAPAAGGFTGDALPLGPGSHGALVSYVEKRLQQLGYYHGAVTQDFTQPVSLAVQQFQATAAVTGDAASTVGRHTLVALIAAGDTPNLHTGSHSSAVNRLDSALNAALGSHTEVSSRFNGATTAEVMRYQAAVGLPPTGQVDAATWAKLQSGAL